jgi:hypothetical protein
LRRPGVVASVHVPPVNVVVSIQPAYCPIVYIWLNVAVKAPDSATTSLVLSTTVPVPNVTS